MSDIGCGVSDGGEESADDSIVFDEPGDGLSRAGLLVADVRPLAVDAGVGEAEGGGVEQIPAEGSGAWPGGRLGS